MRPEFHREKPSLGNRPDAFVLAGLEQAPRAFRRADARTIAG
jgi:hypothetical protein